MQAMENMTFLDRAREQSRFVAWLTRISKSIWYPLLYGALCVYASAHEMAQYIPILYGMALTVIFVTVFSDDPVVLYTPFLLTYYSIAISVKQDMTPAEGESLALLFDKGLHHILLCAGILLTCTIYKFWVSGVLRSCFRQKGKLFWGIVILDVTFVANGLFSAYQKPIDVLYGLFFALGITLSYVLTLGVMEHAREGIIYICKVVVCMGYTILAEVLFLAARLYKDGTLFLLNEDGTVIGVQRQFLEFSWGVTTVVAATIALAIPAALYLAYAHRHAPMYYFSAVIFVAGTVVLQTRSAEICGFLILLVGSLICCSGGKNRRSNCVCAIAAFGIALIGMAIAVLQSGGAAVYENIITLMRFDRGDGGRFLLWQNGWQDFRSSPLFGVGFSKSARPIEETTGNMFCNMYHNIGIELVASMGFVGLVAFLLHVRQAVALAFRRPTAEKLLLLLLPLMVVVMSFVDNFFFYFSMQIMYGAFLAMAEKAEADRPESSNLLQ